MLGITGTGGAGKSSLTDELIRRLRLDQNDKLRVAIISIDPSRRKSGGALLGDRIRMNAINPWTVPVAGQKNADSGQRVFMRSLATRDVGSEISQALPDVIAACKCAGFDLIVVETSGIGQGDAAIVPHVDVPMYVMTPEFGAASQLEKIDMLDFADFIAINKFDRKGALDALRDVSKQVQRNKEAWGTPADKMPVFGTMAARFNDDGVTALYQASSRAWPRWAWRSKAACCPRPRCATAPTRRPWCRPRARATWPRSATPCAATKSAPARRPSWRAKCSSSKPPPPCSRSTSPTAHPPPKPRWTWPATARPAWTADARALLAQWPDMQAAYAGDEYVVKIRDKEIRTALTTKSSRAPRSAKWPCRSTKTTAKSSSG